MTRSRGRRAGTGDHGGPRGPLTRLAWLAVPLGVFRDLDEAPYEELNKQMAENARAAKGTGDLGRLLNSGETWTIK